MNASIYFPPQFEPFQPYLAGAALISAFREQGKSAEYHDLNLHYYNHILGSIPDNICIRGGNNSNLTYDDYVDTIRKLDSRLRCARKDGEAISLYESAFGDQLYGSEGLRNLISSDWAHCFRSFLDVYFASHPKALRSSIHAVTLIVHDQLPAAIILSDFLRSNDPRNVIIWGGPLVSRIGREIRNDEFLATFFDTIVVGPGEPFLKTISNEIRRGLVRTSSSRLRPCLPEFSSYPLQDYFSHFLVLPYLTSRGCYWSKCEFCCHYRPFDQYGKTDIATVVDHLEALSLKHDTKYFSFSDECIPATYLKKLSEEIYRRHLDIRWFTFARFEPGFNQSTCKLLYEAGCRVLMFGLESASQRILDLMNKGTKIEDVRPVLNACKNAGISVRVDVMIGFPTETREESEQTLFFLLENRDVLDTPFSVTPLSKFELQEDAIMQYHLARFGVKSLGKLRGPLDYQHRYRMEIGMNMDEVEDQYHRFVRVISKEFKAHARMPENKTHAFLFKCNYSDSNIEETIYDDRIIASRLEDYEYKCLDDLLLERECNDTWILRSPEYGGVLRLGQGLVTVVNDISKNGRITEEPEGDEIRQQVAELLTYLNRQGFLKAKLCDSPIGSPLLRV